MKLIEALKHYESGKTIKLGQFTFSKNCMSFPFTPVTFHNFIIDESWEVVEEREYFDFHRAIEELKTCKKVSRKEWENLSTIFICFSEKPFYRITSSSLIVNQDNCVYDIKITDINADDWYVYDGKK